mgnify:CR=1 FL=1
MLKKIVVIILSVFVVTSSVIFTTAKVAAVSNTTLIGDANRDGKLDSTDAMYMLYYIALVGVGYSQSDVYSHFDIEINEKLLDVDRNEKIDTTDVLYLLTYVAKCGVGQDATWPPAPEKVFSDDVLVFNPIKGVETWNLRSGPSLDAGVVTKMSAGESCKVVKIMPESWYEVEYFGVNLYLQIASDAKDFFYVDPIPQEVTTYTTSTTTETTTTTTTEATKSTKDTTNLDTKTETTTESAITTQTESTTMKSETTSELFSETTTAMTTKPTTKTTTTAKTTDNSTTTSTERTTSITTTEKLQLGDFVTPTENVKLTNSNGEITVDAGEFITIVAVNESGNYVVIYQKQLYELNNTACLNKVEHVYQEKQLSTVEEIEDGDILKFTGDTWYIRDESQSAIGTLKKNELFVIMAKNGNVLTIITSDGTMGNIFCIADKYCLMN